MEVGWRRLAAHRALPVSQWGALALAPTTAAAAATVCRDAAARSRCVRGEASFSSSGEPRTAPRCRYRGSKPPLEATGGSSDQAASRRDQWCARVCRAASSARTPAPRPGTAPGRQLRPTWRRPSPRSRKVSRTWRTLATLPFICLGVLDSSTIVCECTHARACASLSLSLFRVAPRCLALRVVGGAVGLHQQTVMVYATQSGRTVPRISRY